MTIEKGKIGVEDIEFGQSTFQRRGQSGSHIPITRFNASHLPVIDTTGRFVSTDVEGCLAELQPENAIGSNSKDYTNKSGATRSIGDVVIIDIDNDEAYKTTVTAGDTRVLGVVAESTLNNASGKVITGGYVAQITVDAACARGSYLKSSTTAGKASPSTTFVAGCFALALTASGGPGTVSAFLFGTIGGDLLPLSGGSLSGILRFKKGADLTSAASLTLGTDGNYFDVTGTNAITSISASGQLGTIIWLHFDDILTLTHHATDLILPGGANIATSAGDEFCFIEYDTGKWRCVGYIDASTTGTGNIVRATIPTLTTPKIDTINEETSANGVVVDGVKHRDGYDYSSGVRNSSHETLLDFSAYTAGDTLFISADTERTQIGIISPMTKIKEIKIARGGTLRIKFDGACMQSGGAPTIYDIQIYRNGSAVGTLRQVTLAIGSFNYTTYSEDLSGWQAGDLCQLYWAVNGTDDTMGVRNFRIYAATRHGETYASMD